MIAPGNAVQQPGLQVEGCGREGDRFGQGERAWRHGGRQHRLAASPRIPTPTPHGDHSRTLIRVTDLQEERLRALETKLFGSGAVDIPRPLMEVLAMKVTFKEADEAQMAAFSRYDKGEFGAYRLNGHLLYIITFRGKDSDASAEEFAYPLSTVSSVKTSYKFEYDDFRRRRTWTPRNVTIEFRDEEPIILESVEEDTNQGRFARAILSALAKDS